MRLWSALFTVSAALERRVSFNVIGNQCFPNLYVLFVTGPAVGKSVALNLSLPFLQAAGTNLMPTSVTKQQFLYKLDKSCQRSYIWETPPLICHCATVASREFRVFMGERDAAFMADLTDLYDCPEKFTRETKTQDSHFITNACVNILGCTTPEDLARILPEGAFDMGFSSRFIIIHGGSKPPPKYRKPLHDEGLELCLKHDIQQIAGLKGEFTFVPEVEEELAKWYEGGMPPLPMDPKLANYSGRRLAHFVKLCMIASASRGDSLLITSEDYAYAKEILLSAEGGMPAAVSEMGKHTDALVVEHAYDHVVNYWNKVGQPMKEGTLRQRIYKECPVHAINYVISTLVNSNLLQAIGEFPNREFLPGKKE